MRRGLLSVTLAGTLSCGCGSIGTQIIYWQDRPPMVMTPPLWHGITIYGGTAFDLGVLGWLFGCWEPRPDAQNGAFAMFALDLPFSLVVDTVLLPLTLGEQIATAFTAAPER